MQKVELCLLACFAFLLAPSAVFASGTSTEPVPATVLPVATISVETQELPAVREVASSSIQQFVGTFEVSAPEPGIDEVEPPPPPPEPPAPVSPAPSSLLFLPGIMGSHLYEEDDACLGRGEQRRWFSASGCDHERLLLTGDGTSQRDIYTKFTDSGIADAVFTLTLYKKFIGAFTQLEERGVIDSFVPFPYDWRLRLGDILRAQEGADGRVRPVPGAVLEDGLLYQTVTAMASTSMSGKVTIVAHSNGGLVAKAFMAELEAIGDPLIDQIDALILIGSPQVGTPDAVTGILQGTAIADGWVVRQDTARMLLNNAPFGYHLLPNEYYFDGAGVAVDTPVVVFDEGAATDAYRAQFGERIDSANALEAFLGSRSGRVKPAPADLSRPEVGNDALLAYAAGIGDTLAAWQPGASTTVYQLAGTGLWTPKTLRYYTGATCVRERLIGKTCLAYEPALEYQLYFTREGDGTVVVPSAVAMAEAENVERWWINLFEYNDSLDKNYLHRDLLETEIVQNFIQQIAVAQNPVANEFLSTAAPSIADEHVLVYHLHSPLELSLTSPEGTLSSTTGTLPGGVYRRFGEVQYLIVPVGTIYATVHLRGTGSGSFTLIAEEWVGEEVRPLADYRAIPTATSTVATMQVGETLLSVDFDGDGVPDATVDPASDVLTSLKPEAVAVERRDRQSTRLPQPVPQVAGLTAEADLVRLQHIISLLDQVVALVVKLHSYD